MRYLIALLSVLTSLHVQANLQECSNGVDVQPPEPIIITSEPLQVSFTPFTGKVLKNKVRMRVQPNLEGAIVRELNVNDLVLVVGESEDFYGIEPPTETKAYIYKTYVVDGLIEGHHVNVRLEPSLNAPVIAQLNSGDHVQGAFSGTDKRWLEINPPKSIQFYVAKEYIERAGDTSLIARVSQRRSDVLSLLESARTASQSEFQKPFEQIHLETINHKLNTVVSKYPDFPNEAAIAKEMLRDIQTAYLHKKVSFMESRPQVVLASSDAAVESPIPTPPPLPPAINSRMAVWMPIEEQLYNEWAAQHMNASREEYYHNQMENALSLHGTIETYNRNVKNKPGDFVLISSTSHLPIAYLYSTEVNLQDYVGREIAVKVSPRDNKSFAYPAYIVLGVD